MTEYPRTRPPGAADKQPAAAEFPFEPKKTRAPQPPAPAVEPQAAPREGREFPCAQCGAALRFDPKAQSLTCEHCGHVQEIPQSAEQVQELCFRRYFEQGRVAEEVLAGADSERRCDGCGAMVVFRADTATDRCPFCDTHLTNPVHSPTPMMRPGGVLPFLIAKDEAKARFHRWVASRWFAPKEFKRLDSLDRINGLYVPHWTYDAMTYSFYSGHRGDAYYVTVGTGKNRRTERRIRWRHVTGRVNHWFDDVLVCASKSLPDAMVRDLEPWDLKAAAAYEPAYLSGFRTERYQIPADEGFQRAASIMDGVIHQFVRRDIGGDEQRVDWVKTQVDGVTFKLLLLPVWLTAFRYKDTIYRVLINARTGEVQGQRPWSAAKIASAILVALAVLVPVVLILLRMG